MLGKSPFGVCRKGPPEAVSQSLRTDGSERGLQSGGADNGYEDNVRRRQRCEFEQTLTAREHFGGSAESLPQIVRVGRVVDRDGFGPMLQRLFGKQFGITTRSETDETNTIGKVFGHFECAGANGAGAAKQNNVFHFVKRDASGRVADRDTSAAH